jgi:hypothetical protein
MADIDLDNDADVATAVLLLDAQGDHETADLLEIAPLAYEHQDWSEYRARLEVEIALLHLYTEEVCLRIQGALNAVLRASPEWVPSVVPYSRKVQGDWRALRREGRLTGIANQGTRLPLQPNHPRKYGLNFRDSAEVKVFDALRNCKPPYLLRTPSWWLRMPWSSWPV